jgi:hypothetical protein
MKFLAPVSLALTLLTPATTAINFWLIEAQITSFCWDTSVPCGNVNIVNMVTQNGNTPGCEESNSARSAGGSPPGNFFSSVACGVEVDFYKNGNDYEYFKKNGGSIGPLGRCVPNTPNKGKGCLGAGYNTYVQGKFACTNYRMFIPQTLDVGFFVKG